MGYLEVFFLFFLIFGKFPILEKNQTEILESKNSTNAVEFIENRVNQMEERVSELRQESKNTLSRRGERTKDFESKKFLKKTYKSYQTPL